MGNQSSTKRKSSRVATPEIDNEMRSISDIDWKPIECDEKVSLHLVGQAKQFDQQSKELQERIEACERDDSMANFLKFIKKVVPNKTDFNLKDFQAGIENTEAMYDYYHKLLQSGIVKNSAFEAKMRELLILCQTQFELLNESYDVLQDLITKCEISRLSIILWKKQGKNASKNTINKAMEELSQWLQNQDKLVNLHKKWQEFRKEAELFQLSWTQVAESVKNELKNVVKSKLSKYFYMVFGGAVGSLGTAATLSIIAFTMIPVANAALLVFASCLVVSGVALSALLHHLEQKVNDKTGALESAEQKMLDGVDEMTDNIGQMAQDAKKIEFKCLELKRKLDKQDKRFQILSKHCDNVGDLWDEIEVILNEIDGLFLAFKTDCEMMSVQIEQSQMRIAGIHAAMSEKKYVHACMQ